MKMRSIATACLLVAPLLFGSCNKFLDETPDERVYLRTAEDIRRHLVFAYPTASFAYICELSSDNVDDYGTDVPEFTNFERDAVYWLDGQEYNNADGLRALWREHYSAIQHANNALAAIDRLGGGAELRPHRGEALLARAYAHFVLVNLFGKPYNGSTSTQDLGVPYVTQPETELSPSYTRQTVAEVYAAIDRDLTEGLPLLSDSYYAEPKYHFNKAAAEAFAARFYLYYEQWAKAVEHADKALEGKAPRTWADFQEASIVGAKTEDAYAKLYSRSTQAANLLILPVTSQVHTKMSYSSDKRFSMTHRAAEEIFLGQNIWRSSTTAQADYWQIPFVSPSYNYRDVIYQAKYPSYASNKNRTLIVPFTTEETLLVRAEAKALQQDYTGALADANAWSSAYLNTPMKSFTQDSVLSYWKAMAYSTETEPTMKKELHPAFSLAGGETQEALLQHILHCRRVATAHEGLRWFDLRRYGITIYRYVHDSKDREKYSAAKTLTREDDHYTFQLPENVRTAGMTPNPRTN